MTSSGEAGPTAPAQPSWSASAPRSGFPLWTKLLFGCLGLWVLILAVVGVTAWVAFRRLAAPAEPVAAETFIGRDAQGWARLSSVRGDPGLRGLVSHFVSEVQRQDSERQREALPEWARGFQDFAEANRNDAAWLGMLLPGKGLVRFEIAPETGEVATVAALEVGLIARVVGWTASWDDSTEAHRGFTLIPLDGGAYLGLRNGDLLAATDYWTLERAIDRLEDGAVDGVEEEPEAEPAAGRLPAESQDERWDLVGTLDNRRNAFHDALATLAAAWPMQSSHGAAAAEPPSTEAVETASWRLDMVTADQVEGTIELELTDPVTAWAWAERLAAGDGWRQDGLQLRVQAGNEAGRAVADFELSGLQAWLTGVLEKPDTEAP